MAARSLEQKARRPVLQSFSWVVLASFSRQVAFFVVSAVLFERLSRSTFGALALAFGYMQVFAGLGEFGIRQIGWREIARHPERARALTGPHLSAKSLTTLLSVALYLLLMPWLWEAGAPPAIYLAYALGIALNGGTFDFPFFGLSRMDLVARYSVAAFSVYLIGCLVLVTDDRQAWLVPLLLALSMALLLALQLRWFLGTYGGLRLRLPTAELARIVRQSWPLGLGETLNRLALAYPLFLIGLTVGQAGVGSYRIAELAFSFLAQFGHLFAAAGFSHLSHTFKHRRSQLPDALRRLLWPLAGGGLAAGALLCWLGPTVFQFVFDTADEDTLDVLRILGVALIFAAPARFLKALLASVDRQGLMLVINALTLGVGGGLGWLAVSVAGIRGMAVAVLVAESITLAALVVIYWRLKNDNRMEEV